MTPPIDLTAALAINGWMPRSELQWLAEQAQRAQMIVEIGAWRGRSTRALYDHVLPGGHVYTIDTWAGDPRDPEATRKTRKHYQEYAALGADGAYQRFRQQHAVAIAAGRLEPLQLPSVAGVAAVLQAQGQTIDFVFIDGCHQYAAVAEDIAACRRLVRPGGLLSGHDYLHRGHPGVKQAVDEVFAGRFAQHGAIWFLTMGDDD